MTWLQIQRPLPLPGIAFHLATCNPKWRVLRSRVQCNIPRAYATYSIQGIINGRNPAAGWHSCKAKSNGDTRHLLSYPVSRLLSALRSFPTFFSPPSPSPKPDVTVYASAERSFRIRTILTRQQTRLSLSRFIREIIDLDSLSILLFTL